MIQIILGKKGTGKTKTIIDLANTAVANSSGNVVVVEKGNKLTFDINHKARLINTEEYKIEGCDKFFGFLMGIVANDYDVTDIFIDGTYKILAKNDPALVECFIKGIEQVQFHNDINFVLTVSEEPANVSEYVKKFCKV